MNQTDFLQRFLYGDGYIAVAIGDPKLTEYHKEPPGVPEGTDVYFSPANRHSPSEGKDSVSGTKALWVDADEPRAPLSTLPPSMSVFSGHGWHLYWFLDEPLEDIEEIERLNKLLVEDVPSADPGSFNVNRVLRVPGTLNTKEDPIKEVVLKGTSEVEYKREDFSILEKLNRKTRHKVRTGDSRGYRSRSERDWAILRALVSADATDELIHKIFQHQPCGDKYRESKKYFERSLQKARERGVSEVPDKKIVWEESEEGYALLTNRGRRLVATFTIEPTLLMDGSAFEAEDAIVGNVKASGFTWEDITFTRSAFTSVRGLDRETPMLAWQWLGSDSHVRMLLPYLLEQLKEKGLPRVIGSPALGLHWVKDKPFFLGDKEVLSADEYWKGFDGPIAWLPSKKEHPQLRLEPEPDSESLAVCNELIPQLNEPEVVWPMVGWYAASALKPWLEQQGYRFPTLSVVGTKGSGKTTLIQRVMMPLFGQVDCKSYDAGTTRFVILALLGSSNAVPLSFSEFRYESVERFLRYVLLAYDTGHDPRGRPDQTTVDYPLSAPFTLDGEDLIADPAARERIVVAQLDPQVIEEGGNAYNAYHEYRSHDPLGVGGFFLRHALERLTEGSLEDVLTQSREDLFSTFPGRMPDRVRNNHIVIWFGAVLWAEALGVSIPDTEVLGRSIGSIYNITAGRARTLADDLVEDIVNAASSSTKSFKWSYDGGDRTLWFQLSSAHSWWLASRRRQGRGGLERDALRAQLLEAPYTFEPKIIEGAWMYGINLQQAQDAGLDTVAYIKDRQMTVKF